MEHTIAVGILGCTGTVGQKFIELLNNHPFFEVIALGASEKSVGSKYGDIVNWKQNTPIPPKIRELEVFQCEPSNFKNCRVIFSGLDASVAGEVEENFAKADFAVFSNARNHRMDPDVPILIPAVNPNHIDIVPHQQKQRGYKKGFIVTNANCSSTGLVVALKPLADAFGIEKCLLFTMQAISGAGYPGVPSLDILDNVIPFISGEEEKLEIEPKKILGNLKNNLFEEYPFTLSAHCNRVAVSDGHTESVSIQLKTKGVDLKQIKQVLQDYHPEIHSQLPSAPKHPIVVLEQNDRPQPRLDRTIGNGYTVTVGRIRKCNLFDVKLTLLSHNTVIGAAGGSILNAELAKLKGLL